MEYDAIILGAGGAGLMAAATAGQAGASVLVIDHADRPGKKILISGGGRCNFTNTGTGPENFLSGNAHFSKSALSRYTPQDFLALVERHGIAWHEKTLGQLFCEGSARQIVAMLLDECRKGAAEVRLAARMGEIEHADGRFRLAGCSARQLVIATRGPSIPKMGATGIAYDIARRFGLDVVPPRPALVPLTLGEAERDFTSIPGVSCPAVAKVRDVAFEEAALFTHRGLSGPAILQISSFWTPGEEVSLSVLANAADELRAARRDSPRAHLRAVLGQHLPNRLAEALAIRVGIVKELGNFTDADLETTAATLTRLTFRPTGTEGFAKAEVTAGGISTASLSSKTMEARDVPGLYAIGEVAGRLQLSMGPVLRCRGRFGYCRQSDGPERPSSERNAYYFMTTDGRLSDISLTRTASRVPWLDQPCRHNARLNNFNACRWRTLDPRILRPANHPIDCSLARR